MALETSSSSSESGTYKEKVVEGSSSDQTISVGREKDSDDQSDEEVETLEETMQG